MAFSWSESIAQGQIVTKAALDEIRTNIDYIDDNRTTATCSYTSSCSYTNSSTNYYTANCSYTNTSHDDSVGSGNSTVASNSGTTDNSPITSNSVTSCSGHYTSDYSEAMVYQDFSANSSVNSSN